jgi:hypothetical protein
LIIVNEWIAQAAVSERKKQVILNITPPILARIGLNSEQWLSLTTEFEQHFTTSAGNEHMLQQFKQHTDNQRVRGMEKARVLLQHA